MGAIRDSNKRNFDDLLTFSIILKVLPRVVITSVDVLGGSSKFKRLNGVERSRRESSIQKIRTQDDIRIPMFAVHQRA